MAASIHLRAGSSTLNKRPVGHEYPVRPMQTGVCHPTGVRTSRRRRGLGAEVGRNSIYRAVQHHMLAARAFEIGSVFTPGLDQTSGFKRAPGLPRAPFGRDTGLRRENAFER